MNEEITSIVKPNIDTQIEGLVETIIDEQDPNKTKDLVDLFNWNMSKKNVVRLQKLNTLYDSITDQMIERVDKRSDQFSNSDLLDYVKTIQGAIDINSKNLAQVKEPPLIVHQTNTQINVNLAAQFDRDAKARILAAVEETLKQATQPVVDATVVNIENTSEYEEH